jgi:hypothetical protein
MLGFTPLSQISISQSYPRFDKFVVLGTTVLALSPGVLDHTLEASLTIPSTSASFSVNAFGEVDAQATVDLVSTLAQTSLADFSSVTGLANTTLPVATASFTFQTPTITADSSTNINSLESTFSIAGVDITADANITTDSVSSVLDQNDLLFRISSSVDIPSIQFSIFAEDLSIKVNASRVLDNLSITTTATDGLQTSADANLDLFAVEDTIALVSDVTPKASSNIELNTLNTFLTTSLSLPDRPTAETFDFTAYANLYSRNRTVYIVSYDQGNTVHIHPENRTVYVDKDTQSYTVYIAA